MALEQGGVKQGSRVYIFRPRVVYGATIHKEQLLKISRLLFDSKRDELTGEWRQQHNEELDVLYCSRNIVWVIKERRMRWAGHVAPIGRGEARVGFWRIKLRERVH